MYAFRAPPPFGGRTCPEFPKEGKLFPCQDEKCLSFRSKNPNRKLLVAHLGFPDGHELRIMLKTCSTNNGRMLTTGCSEKFPRED